MPLTALEASEAVSSKSRPDGWASSSSAANAAYVQTHTEILHMQLGLACMAMIGHSDPVC